MDYKRAIASAKGNVTKVALLVKQQESLDSKTVLSPSLDSLLVRLTNAEDPMSGCEPFKGGQEIFSGQESTNIKMNTFREQTNKYDNIAFDQHRLPGVALS